MGLFMEVRPDWVDGQLHVSSLLRDGTAAWAKVSVVLAYAWRWQSWPDTRWMKAGASGRMLLLSLTCGIAQHAEDCMEDPRIGACALGGLRKCTADTKRTFVICCCTSGPCEVALVNILKDDRLLRFGYLY